MEGRQCLPGGVQKGQESTVRGLGPLVCEGSQGEEVGAGPEKTRQAAHKGAPGPCTELSSHRQPFPHCCHTAEISRELGF